MPTEQPRPPRQTPTNQSLLEASPWLPAKWELADATALQAVARGDASESQQRRALDWIIRQACSTYDFAYRPGANDRDTTLALGRQFVGQQIVKLLATNVGALRRSPEADPAEGG